eukprot:6181917-Pleurochrysis_carterae.AAC.1
MDTARSTRARAIRALSVHLRVHARASCMPTCKTDEFARGVHMHETPSAQTSSQHRFREDEIGDDGTRLES